MSNTVEPIKAIMDGHTGQSDRDRSVSGQMDAAALHQRFELFSHRCAFVLTALEKLAFEFEPVNSEPISLGAAFYVGDLQEEMVDLRLMIEELHQGDL